MKVLGRYKNGNYDVTLLSDGTKIRETEDDEFIPDFAESMDIKLTNHCSLGCPYCHEGSTPEGEHGDILNEKFIDTLHPYQEVALGGGGCNKSSRFDSIFEKTEGKTHYSQYHGQSVSAL